MSVLFFVKSLSIVHMVSLVYSFKHGFCSVEPDCICFCQIQKSKRESTCRCSKNLWKPLIWILSATVASNDSNCNIYHATQPKIEDVSPMFCSKSLFFSTSLSVPLTKYLKSVSPRSWPLRRSYSFDNNLKFCHAAAQTNILLPDVWGRSSRNKLSPGSEIQWKHFCVRGICERYDTIKIALAIPCLQGGMIFSIEQKVL